MYEPITVVKVRKETKVTVPAGGWILIGQPDEPLHVQIARRAALLKEVTNDDYEKLLIGRLQSTHPAAAFPTKAAAAEADKAAAQRDAALNKSSKDAAARAKKLAEEAAATAAKAHAAKLEEVNAVNDSIRKRDTGKAEAPDLKIETK